MFQTTILRTFIFRSLQYLALGIACAGLSACGNSGNANGDMSNPGSGPGLYFVAGNIGGLGYADDMGTDARFNGPDGIAMDKNGNLYVADRTNAAIRKITPDGAVSTIAGNSRVWGNADGPASSAQFYVPQSIAVDGSGNVFVADYSGIRKISSSGTVSTILGASSWSQSIATDEAGNLYVADSYTATIRKITPSMVVTTVAGVEGVRGNIDGVGASALFNNFSDITSDVRGNLYVIDSRTIRKITPTGVVTTLAGNAGAPGTADGVGNAAEFSSPSSITIDGAGNLYVIDGVNIRKVTQSGIVTTLYITSGVDPFFGAGNLTNRADLVVDISGNLYIADELSNAITKITPDGVASTFAGMPGQSAYHSSSVDGVGKSAQFRGPNHILADNVGNLYVSELRGLDTAGGTLPGLALRKVTPTGVVTTLAGQGLIWGNVDPTGASAKIAVPSGMATDAAGNIYVIDAPFSSPSDIGVVSSGGYTVSKISPDGVVTLIAGEYGVRGTNDGIGTAAHFSDLTGITIDNAGNLFVADANRIRKISPNGAVTTLATIQGSDSSEISLGGIAMDAAGNLFVTTPGKHTVEKITPAGTVSTLAGTVGVAGNVDGTGAQAQFQSPGALTVDASGNLYVADGSAIRKITPNGQVTRIAGIPGQSGVRLGNLPGRLAAVNGLTFIGDNILAITSGNSMLKLVLP